MKLFLLSLLCTLVLFAADAKEAAAQLGVENNFAAALKKAQSEKKMLVMVIVRKNCRWCDRLVTKTLSEPEVKEKLKNYVTLIVDRNDNYPSAFKEDFFPSIFYIDAASGKSVYDHVGFVGKESFLNDLNIALQTRKDLYE